MSTNPTQSDLVQTEQSTSANNGMKTEVIIVIVAVVIAFLAVVVSVVVSVRSQMIIRKSRLEQQQTTI